MLLEHDAEKLNDDCLGNMLDAVSEQSDAIWVSVIGQALQAYPALAERVISTTSPRAISRVHTLTWTWPSEATAGITAPMPNRSTSA